MQEEQKQMILLLRTEGESYANIANFLELSPNTVKSFCTRNNITFPEKKSQVATTKTTSEVCPNCGSPLVQTINGRKKKFCSDRCRYLWWNQNRNRKPYYLTCQYCHKKFISFGNKHRNFCSRACYLQSHVSKEEL